MKKYSVILALALALVLAMGISTAFAAGDADYYGGPYDGITPPLADNKVTEANKPVGQGFATKGADYNKDLTVNDAAYWGNANETGLTDEGFGILRTIPGQDTHGEYKKNTNSCASCHMTHTAAGAKLLFRNGIYNTCAACHDGSLGFANVFATGTALATKMSADPASEEDLYFGAGGGTFAGTLGTGASMHLATGALELKAAPGGMRMEATTDGTEPFDTAARMNWSWTSEFTCASCHAPHGSYSDRLLHYNPNNIGTFTSKYGGLKKTGVSVASDSYDYDNDGDLDTVYFVPGATAGFVNRDKTPWLYGYDSYGKPNWTQVKADGVEKTKSLHVEYGNAFFTDPDGVLAGTITMDVAPALVVKLNITGHSVTGYGNAKDSNVFCAACHTDYNQGTRVNIAQANAGATSGVDGAGVLRGTWSKGFRHNITGRSAGAGQFANGTGSMSCLTCHFAHGTSGEIMLNADNTFINLATDKDVNASSALKRYTNQAVCWRCHVSSHATTLKNNDGFWNGVGDGLEIYEELNH